MVVKLELDIASFNKNSKQTIGIYGVCGFIGSKLLGILLEKGYNVIGFDNLYKSIDSILDHFGNPRFKFEFCDISKDKDVIKSFENKMDGIILLSGIVGLDACDYNISLASKVNDYGWANIAQYKPKNLKIVGASTGSVFGKVTDELCTEDTKCNPLSHYGITKLAGEKHIVNVGGVALRFATAAGVSPKIRLNLLPNYLTHEAIHKQYLSVFQPDAMRTFIDIRDFCDSMIFCLENFDKLKYKIYNVGDEANNWSKRQLVEYIQSKTNCKVDFGDSRIDNDFRDYAVCYDRIHEEGFKCKYKISDTIDQLLEVMPYVKIQNPYT